MIVTASRNGVSVKGRWPEIEPVMLDAGIAYKRLARGEDVTDMATHRFKARGRELVSLVPAETTEATT